MHKQLCEKEWFCFDELYPCELCCYTSVGKNGDSCWVHAQMCRACASACLCLPDVQVGQYTHEKCCVHPTESPTSQCTDLCSLAIVCATCRVCIKPAPAAPIFPPSVLFAYIEAVRLLTPLGNYARSHMCACISVVGSLQRWIRRYRHFFLSLPLFVSCYYCVHCHHYNRHPPMLDTLISLHMLPPLV